MTFLAPSKTPGHGGREGKGCAMERNVTVSVRSLVLVGVVLLALRAGWALGGGPGGAPTAARPPMPARPRTPAAATERRTVEMTGVGSVSAVPDEVGFGVSVGLTRPDLSTALDDASATMAKVLGRLADFGVVEDRVQTTGLSMEPVYDYPRYGSPVLRGYRVTQRARVTVPELKRAGGAITAAVRAGGNAVRVGDIRLLVGDRARVLEQARDAAVAEATAKAEQYAEATGQRLGDVLSLREVAARRPADVVRRGLRVAPRGRRREGADQGGGERAEGDRAGRVVLRLSPWPGRLPMRHAGAGRTRLTRCPTRTTTGRPTDPTTRTRHARAWHRPTT